MIFNLSFNLAPIRYPCIITGGLVSLSLNPKRYKWLEIPTSTVFCTSNEIQSIFSSVDVIAFGVMILVINALSSFENASFLNPSDASEICPKFELELVTL